MKRTKLLALLGTCPFYMTAGWTAESTEESWWTRTWKDMTGSTSELQFDESHSQQTQQIFTQHQQSDTILNLYDHQGNDIFPTDYSYSRLSAHDINNFYPGSTGQTFELQTLSQSQSISSYQPYTPIYPQYLPSAPYATTVPQYTVPQYQQTRVSYQSTNTPGLLFTHSHVQELPTFHAIRPPEHSRYISPEDVQRMKKDKTSTNKLLDLIYWGIVPNCYTRKDLTNNSHVRTILQTVPDHRFWDIIYTLDGFSEFPGLVNIIQGHADNGLATAQNQLGVMYLNGTGVAKNIFKAIRYFQLSANQGFAWAQNSLGCLYYSGSGVKQDYMEAIRLFSLAADQNLPRAKYSLGCCYEMGRGVEKSIDQALKFYFSANIDAAIPCITALLEPVYVEPLSEKFRKTFSEESISKEIEENLMILISAYAPDAHVDLSFFPEKQQMEQVEFRSWLYNGLTTQVAPCLEVRHNISTGFYINCVKLKPNVTLSRAKINPAPDFSVIGILKKNRHHFLTLGEENVIIAEKFMSAICFLEEANVKRGEMFAIKQPTPQENSHIRKLEMKVSTLKKLFAHETSEDKKAIYKKKLNSAECDLEMEQRMASNLEMFYKAHEDLKKAAKNLKYLGNLFYHYVDKSYNRNEQFLNAFPYLRAKK